MSDIDPGVYFDPASDSNPEPAPGSDEDDREGIGPPQLDRVPEGQTDADAVVDAIETRSHPDSDIFNEETYSGEWLVGQNHHRPDELDLPGFGEPDEDCGDYHIAASQFCIACGKPHQFKHNCLRYDCPQHAPYAIRRRAAGAAADTGMVGAAPKLDALRRYLNSYRPDNQRFHHLVVSIPDDYYFGSYVPLEKAKEVVRELMDEFGIQGVVAYHPYRGENEDHEGGDRGAWRRRLFHNRDWSDVNEELKLSPHFHILGVSHFVDGGEITKQIESETGWIIERIHREDSSVSIPDDPALARALTYALSHAGIYETKTGQRRLAAWYLGPDANRVKTFDKSKALMRPIVYEQAKETLGIDPPDLECDHEVPEDVDEPPEIDADQDVESGAVAIDSWPWPDAPDGRGDLPRVNRTDLPRDRHVEGVAAMADAPSELDGAAGDVPDDLGAGTSGSSSGDRDDHAGDDPGRDQDVEPELETCGGRLRHISKAGEYLLEGEWRRHAPHADELETLYVDYVAWATAEDRDPLDDPRPMLAEAQELEDRPPPDPPPDD